MKIKVTIMSVGDGCVIVYNVLSPPVKLLLYTLLLMLYAGWNLSLVADNGGGCWYYVCILLNATHIVTDAYWTVHCS